MLTYLLQSYYKQCTQKSIDYINTFHFYKLIYSIIKKKKYQTNKSRLCLFHAYIK